MRNTYFGDQDQDREGEGCEGRYPEQMYFTNPDAEVNVPKFIVTYLKPKDGHQIS